MRRDFVYGDKTWSTVSIHASVKDATKWACRDVVGMSFNPRICKRCDATQKSPHTRYQSFNPRICKRCDKVLRMLKLWRKRFNPRICKRCDRLTCSLISLISVSIHASVKDATNNRLYVIKHISVSIHASVKDATFAMLMLISVILFQSTHL